MVTPTHNSEVRTWQFKKSVPNTKGRRAEEGGAGWQREKRVVEVQRERVPREGGRAGEPLPGLRS